MFDAYTGTYNDLCHIICYFRKLQAPRSALVCGATCGMHVFAGFVDKFFGHFRPEIGYGARQSGSRNLYKTGLEGFGRHPVFTTVFTGKYRPGKNRFWTPKVGKTGKNTTLLFKQFHISIKSLIWPWNTLIQDVRILSSCLVWIIVSK